jgi:hypothetical protein
VRGRSSEHVTATNKIESEKLRKMTVDLTVLQCCGQFASDVPPFGLGGFPRVGVPRRAKAVTSYER